VSYQGAACSCWCLRDQDSLLLTLRFHALPVHDLTAARDTSGAGSSVATHSGAAPVDVCAGAPSVGREDGDRTM
jgi:hypothetical protein